MASDKKIGLITCTGIVAGNMMCSGIALLPANLSAIEAKLNMLYTGWSSSTGELDWAVRPLLATESWAPVAGNYGFYSNAVLDKKFSEALRTTDRAKKTELYDAAPKASGTKCPGSRSWLKRMSLRR